MGGYWRSRTRSTPRDKYQRTALQHQLTVEELEPRVLLYSANPVDVGELTTVGDKLFFVARDARSLVSLFVSDGTGEGTSRLKDVPSKIFTFPTELTAVDDLLFFVVNNDGRRQLWRSDGTELGTYHLTQGVGTEDGAFKQLRDLVNVDGTLFFQADDDVHGRELWKVDSGADRAQLVKDIAPGSAHSSPHSMFALDGQLVFSASAHLWKTDGTEEGTHILVESASPADTIYLDGAFYFSGRIGAWPGIYRYDGQETTRLVNDASLSDREAGASAALDGTIYLSIRRNNESYARLWTTDGTKQGTVLVPGMGAGDESAQPRYFTEVGGSLLFFAGVSTERGLWTTDGTSEGTYRFDNAEISAWGWGERSYLKIDYTLYFITYRPGGVELGKTDGTEAGTILVRDLFDGGGSSPKQFANLNGKLFFTAFQPDNETTLFRSDGTHDGTQRLFEPIGRDSIGLYDATSQRAHLVNSLRRGEADKEIVFEELSSTDVVPLAGDFFGSGRDSVAFYDPQASVFYFGESNGLLNHSVQYGPPHAEWTPVAGDWDGDGIDTFALYNAANGTFYIRNVLAPGFADLVVEYGPRGANWIPLAGDWDADGVDSIALYEPQSSTFFFKHDVSAGFADETLQFGAADSQMIPLAGDWDASGDDSVALFDVDASLFYFAHKYWPGRAAQTVQYGPPVHGWIPLSGNWDIADVTPEYPPVTLSGSFNVTRRIPDQSLQLTSASNTAEEEIPNAGDPPNGMSVASGSSTAPSQQVIWETQLDAPAVDWLMQRSTDATVEGLAEDGDAQSSELANDFIAGRLLSVPSPLPK